MNLKPASALPWVSQPHTDARVYGPNMRNIYTMRDNVPALAEKVGKEDAAYIVHACNAYPQLVDAIREDLKGYLGDFPAGHGVTKLRDLLRKLGEV